MDYRSAAQSLSVKGGDAVMFVTYSDLFQFGMLMIAIIALLENRNR